MIELCISYQHVVIFHAQTSPAIVIESEPADAAPLLNHKQSAVLVEKDAAGPTQVFDYKLRNPSASNYWTAIGWR